MSRIITKDFHLTFEETASAEEMYFYWWLEELIRNEYIRAVVYQPDEVEITPRQTITYNRQKPKVLKEEEHHLLHNLSYTADYLIHWNEKALGIFYYSMNMDSSSGFTSSLRTIPFATKHSGDMAMSWVDVKGTSSRYGQKSDTIFSVIQKVLYAYKGIYVNKVVPIKLFEKTFTPERYLFTDKTKKARTLHYDPVLLNDFLLLTPSKYVQNISSHSGNNKRSGTEDICSSQNTIDYKEE